MRSKGFGLAACLLLVALCGTSASAKEIPQEGASEKGLPTWTRKLPADPAYFYAAQQAPVVMKDVGEAIKKAKDRARQEIAKQVRVRVKAELLQLTGVEVLGGKAREREVVQGKVTSMVDEVLEGVEEVDRYIGDDQVWVLMRLSRQKVLERRLQEERQKKERVLGMFKEALVDLDTKRIALALRNLVLTLDVLEKLFGSLPLVVEVEGRQTELHAHLSGQVQRLLDQIAIKTLDQKVMVSRKGTRSVASFQVRIQDGEESAVVPNLPLSFAIEGCGADLEKRALTDSNGVASTRIRSLGTCREGTLEASLDLRKLVGDLVDEEILATFPRVPKATVRAMIRPAIAARVSGAWLRAQVESLVEAQGFECTTLPRATDPTAPDFSANLYQSGVDYVLLVSTSCGTSYIGSYKMYGAVATGTVQLIQTKTGRRLFYKSASSGKGFGVSKDGACRAAQGKLVGPLKRLVRQALEGV